MNTDEKSAARRELSVAEEIVNSATHGTAFALSIAGLAVLVTMAGIRGGPSAIVGCSIYGATLVMLFGASTLYHSFRSPVAKQRLRVLDHSCIFLLIAGTYTPYTLTQLGGGWGWSLFGIVWGVAAAGIVTKMVCVDKFRIAAPIAYVLMGWLVIIAIRPLVERVPFDNIMWLLAGGIAYTVGIIFYALDKVPYSHAVWHMFVVAGSVCHYIAIMFCVVRTPQT